MELGCFNSFNSYFFSNSNWLQNGVSLKLSYTDYLHELIMFLWVFKTYPNIELNKVIIFKVLPLSWF
jgi:hypothetical protein